jgi:hypothetical protein
MPGWMALGASDWLVLREIDNPHPLIHLKCQVAGGDTPRTHGNHFERLTYVFYRSGSGFQDSTPAEAKMVLIDPLGWSSGQQNAKHSLESNSYWLLHLAIAQLNFLHQIVCDGKVGCRTFGFWMGRHPHSDQRCHSAGSIQNPTAKKSGPSV